MNARIAASLARRTIVPIAMGLSVVTACSESDPAGPRPSSGAPGMVPKASRSPVTRPSGGECRTTFVFQNATDLVIGGTCTLQHLGFVLIEAEQSVTGAVVTNTATYTASNGDELHTTFAGNITGGVFPVITFDGVETYAGGTGRFANASGSALLTGSANLVTSSGEFITKGSITY